jgi:hypothetical protein
MDEIKFCVKSLIIAVALVLAMQIQISGRTIEGYADEWLHTSSAPIYLQKVADGGALALRNAKKAVLDFSGHAFGKTDSNIQRASR